MARAGPTETEIENRFFECLRGTGRGLAYGPVVTLYAGRNRRTERTAKTHLKHLLEGIAAGRITSVSRYKGPNGWVYGTPEDDTFLQAKEDAERPVVDRPSATMDLGPIFQGSPVRSEWTHCPVTSRILRSTIITMGVADFMECPVCNWAHFLGVNPKMKDRRLYAWQVDPLVNAEEYADCLSTLYMGDPSKPGRPQPSQIERIRKGGYYVGLWFRHSGDRDPNPHLTEAGRQGKKQKKGR